MSSQKNKQRILRLLRYLYDFTDEQHPVTNQELVAMFADEVTSGNRKTIKNDIDVLTEAGYDVITSKQYRNSYYMASRIFEVPEVKMLIDAVAASRFITKEKSDVLIGKLSKLVSKPQAETLVRCMYTANVLKPDNEQIYYAIDVITDAINTGRQIRFQHRLLPQDLLPWKPRHHPASAPPLFSHCLRKMSHCLEGWPVSLVPGSPQGPMGSIHTYPLWASNWLHTSGVWNVPATQSP